MCVEIVEKKLFTRPVGYVAQGVFVMLKRGDHAETKRCRRDRHNGILVVLYVSLSSTTLSLRIALVLRLVLI